MIKLGIQFIALIKNFFGIRTENLLQNYSMYLAFHYPIVGLEQEGEGETCIAVDEAIEEDLTAFLSFMTSFKKILHVSLFTTVETKNYPKIS